MVSWDDNQEELVVSTMGADGRTLKSPGCFETPVVDHQAISNKCHDQERKSSFKRQSTKHQKESMRPNET